MTLSISIDPQDPHGSDILSDEEDSSGVHVNSHDFEDYDNEWAHLSYPDELKPSDSASRPRTSHRNRSLHGSRSASGRPNPARRRMVSERESYGTRSRRQPSPEESPDSGDSEEYPSHYSSRPPADRRYPPQAPQAAGYATPSNSSGMGAFPPGHAPPFAGHPNGHIPSALVRFGHADPAAQQYGAGHYPYGAQFQGPHGAAMHQFYGHDPMHPRHPSRPPPQSRMDPHMPGQPPMPPHLAGHVSPPGYAGSPFPQELMHYAQNPFYNYRDPYAMMPGMVPPPGYFPYPQVPSPSQPPEAAASPAPAPAPTPAPAAAPAPAPAPEADTTKDEAIARLEKLIMDERQEREAKEAARLAQIEREKAEKAAREQQLAHDRKIAEEAAFLARADAEKRAAEAAAAAKEEADKNAAAVASEAAKAATEAATAAAEKAAADAAAAAAKAAADAAADAAKKKAAEEKKPPPEKKKPIKFKDAVGRKFSFPFELCETWQGMEDLIKQAFLHIEVIGPHVAEGHYDLVGPNGDIILPQVWETVVEPDWTITMHMWPIPDKPKEPDPPPTKEEAPAAPAKAAPPAAAPDAPKKKPEVVKKPPRRGGGGGFAGWMMGGRPASKGPKPKAEKKPEPAPQ